MSRGIWLCAIIVSCMFMPSATAHEPNTFTMIIGQEEVIPSNVTGQVLFTNDSVWFRNVDDRENITHRVRLDIDGDGLFNGTEDISSGELYSSCELDENGTKINQECEVIYKVLFNESTGLISGIFHYEDISSDGSVFTGRIVVNKDEHSTNVGPDPNYSTEVNNEDGVTYTDNNRQGLIVLSMSAGIAAVAILMIISRPTPLHAEKYRELISQSEE
ncbi:MAG: hypothetical protein VYE51_00325 [Candidatus Thermoplasmatota archaeon]|nr:hypothetical protein [Candidatus Thermoplasmatota archaeon]MEC7601241.1 hypothetical protein [Candidatus Thermoplasmatota archaeon]MEC8384892.1 hypothetical protein [Candidatus Thermoplasmatota archaeon]MEC9118737.1 hypothetical protein [Candidatus Thermoplasmatota archaeon]MED5375511.1 hypothetical protein [Candidatus Thermoplasmatota archaeon]